MSCFWGRGYESTSVRDLATAMGIAGPSLYNAFGDKRALFVEALQHYCRTRTYPLIARIERDHPGAAAIPAFFNEIVDRSVADRERRGCFLINAAIEVAPHDQALRKSVRIHLDALRDFFARHLDAARQDGCAIFDLDGDAVADHLLAVLLGIRVLARSRPERSLLEGIVRSALAQLELTSRSGRTRHRVADARRPGIARRKAVRPGRKPAVR